MPVSALITSCNNWKRLQTLPNMPSGTKLPSPRTNGLGHNSLLTGPLTSEPKAPFKKFSYTESTTLTEKPDHKESHCEVLLYSEPAEVPADTYSHRQASESPYHMPGQSQPPSGVCSWHPRDGETEASPYFRALWESLAHRICEMRHWLFRVIDFGVICFKAIVLGTLFVCIVSGGLQQ